MSAFVYPQDHTVTASPGPTPSQTVGPFFGYALPYEAGPAVAGPERTGAWRLSGQVCDGNGSPVPDALVEIWQADEQGSLAAEPGIFAAATADAFRCFGRCDTDADGRFWFRTVKPGPVPTADGQAQAPHITMCVFARGMLRQAVTRVYFDDEAAANAADPLLATVEPPRRSTLIANVEPDGYRFDVHLQGSRETVFLDVFPR